MNRPTVPPLISKPTGEHFEFLSSARGPEGRFEFLWTLGAGKRGPGEHYHPTETETFTVLSGSIRIWVNGVPNDYTAGMSVAVPPMAPHRFLNRTTEPVVVHVSLDGTGLEDGLVPMAFYFGGRTKLGVRDLGRIIVHTSELDASIPNSVALHRTMVGLGRLLKRFGVRGFEPVVSWESKAKPQMETA